MKGKTVVYESRESYSIKERLMDKNISSEKFDLELWTVIFCAVALMICVGFGDMWVYKVVCLLSLAALLFSIIDRIHDLREIKRLTMEAM